MITIPTDMAVRMSKAGKALEKARSQLSESLSLYKRASSFKEQCQIMEEVSPLYEIEVHAEKEWRDAVKAVSDELYRQNLHDMTEPGS